ncbi:MAG: hypothetical protein GY927_15325 [bacterium]|nr:hypothetical protein [bacterium]
MGEGIAVDARIVYAREQVFADLLGAESPLPIGLRQLAGAEPMYLPWYHTLLPYKSIPFITYHH